MNLQQKLNAFSKTNKFKTLVAEESKNNPKFASAFNGGTEASAKEYGERMREFLRSEILDIKSSTTDESFLDHIIVGTNFVSGTGWTINVSFDEDKMYRDSLYPEGYPDGVQLDEIFNEGYPKIRADVWGEWHGEYTYGLDQRKALYFIQRAVDTFNSKYKGKAVAVYNSKYTGGTL